MVKAKSDARRPFRLASGLFDEDTGAFAVAANARFDVVVTDIRSSGYGSSVQAGKAVTSVCDASSVISLRRASAIGERTASAKIGQTLLPIILKECQIVSWNWNQSGNPWSRAPSRGVITLGSA